MANITSNGRFNPYQTDVNQLILLKTRIDKRCRMCNKMILKGNYAVGKSEGSNWWYSRACLDCSEEFLTNFMKSLVDFSNVAKRHLKDIRKNKEKYTANNVLSKL